MNAGGEERARVLVDRDQELALVVGPVGERDRLAHDRADHDEEGGEERGHRRRLGEAGLPAELFLGRHRLQRGSASSGRIGVGGSGSAPVRVRGG